MPSQIKYETLKSILDGLNAEAPPEYRSYHPEAGNEEHLNRARSRAYIHLYLKVKFGITKFKERHELITEGENDGGLDGYFLDREKKILYLIQSKFRNNASNFEEKSITADELVKMEIERILKGEDRDERGNEFNSKVKKFQGIWRELPDHAHYEYRVIFLCNLTRYTPQQVQRLIGFTKYEVISHSECYRDLVLPLCASTFYDPKEISITIHLMEESTSILDRKIRTKYGEFKVKVLFVPTLEIAKILSKYRNAILKYNPRNYLSLSKNKVNLNIRDTLTQNSTNEFALYNNGITVLASSFKISEETGTVNVGQVILAQPQIINGGQTAYTLCKLYEDNSSEPNDLEALFGGKEVMLRVVILSNDDVVSSGFLEEISNSTNQQSRVEEADRRSNDLIQRSIQNSIYEEFGFLYERKRGEFEHGVEKGYVHKDLVIDRSDFLRAYMAYKGQPRWARQRGSETLFKRESFDGILDVTSDFRKMFFSYWVLKQLYNIQDNAPGWGDGIRYGKMAIIYSIACMLNGSDIKIEDIQHYAIEYIAKANDKWIEFEKSISGNATNKNLYGKEDGNFNFDNYYKGKTVDSDVKQFFTAEIRQLSITPIREHASELAPSPRS